MACSTLAVAQRSDWRRRGPLALPPPTTPPPPPGEHTVALVSTMCDNADSFDSFVCYYLALGFCRLYIYVDDASDPVVGLASRYPSEKLRLHVRGERLRAEWEHLPSWGRLGVYSETEVQARQQLNCEHAMAQARRDSVGWLLHLDSNELLHRGDQARSPEIAPRL